MRIIFTVAPLLIIFMNVKGQTEEKFYWQSPRGKIELTAEGAAHFANLALNCVQREYPNKTGHVMIDSVLKTPRELHPAFYGCFDWHSSVHGHWMLVRLLKLFPELHLRNEILYRLQQNINPENIEQEVDYFLQPSNLAYERMYGWAWLLKLAEELHTWDSTEAIHLSNALQPLTITIVQRYFEFLPRQSYPITTGVHPNTAFGLSFGFDYAVTTGNDSLATLIRNKSIEYFAEDKNCPAEWEPGGEDFFSPCLLEAELMSKVLPSDEFKTWFKAFLPDLDNGRYEVLLHPALVSDRADPKIVHLDGLNLSRAWCMQHIADQLGQSEVSQLLQQSARYHLKSSLPYIASGEYAGEHWLASFAVLAVSGN